MSNFSDPKLPLYQAWQREMVKRGVLTTCLNCESWWSGAINPAGPGASQKPAQCLKFNALPPPEVLVYGCPDWEQLMPF